MDLEEKSPPTSKIHVIDERCKGCALCMEYCPCGVLDMSEAFNRKGYHSPIVVERPACVACQFCEELCPEFAIYCTIGEAQGSRLKANAMWMHLHKFICTGC